jgi:hypothetical protein
MSNLLYHRMKLKIKFERGAKIIQPYEFMRIRLEKQCQRLEED